MGAASEGGVLSHLRKPNPSELLSSEWMEGLLAQLARVADFVIVDTPRPWSSPTRSCSRRRWTR